MSLVEFAARLRRPGETGRRVALAASLVVFTAMAVWAVTEFPTDRDAIDWPLILAVGAVAPSITIWLNAEEWRAQARLLGTQPPMLDALRISVLATAANLLPIPGAAIVRTGALSSRGASVKSATATTAVAGLAWVGSAGVVAGVGLAAVVSTGLGAVAIALAVAALALSAKLATKLGDSSNLSVWGRLAIVEFALSLVSGARYFLFLKALGIDATLAQGLSMSIAGVIASAAGIFPAGLGVREFFAALIAALVDLEPAAGLGAATADRIAGLVILALASGALIWLGGGTRADREVAEATETNE